MLRIYDVMLDWVASLPSVIRAIRCHDRNLADQLQRSSTSVCLNTAEGMGATAGNKLKAYRFALQEMRESVGILTLASRVGYIDGLGGDAVDMQSHIIGTLVKLSKLR